VVFFFSFYVFFFFFVIFFVFLCFFFFQAEDGIRDSSVTGVQTCALPIWAGVLPPAEFARWSVEPTRRIVEGVRAKVPDAKIIGFPRGAGAQLPGYVEATGVNGVSIDWTAEPAFIRERVQSKVAVQGNLDPLVLISGGAALDRAVDNTLANFAQGRFIFNLGHGIQ